MCLGLLVHRWIRSLQGTWRNQGLWRRLVVCLWWIVACHFRQMRTSSLRTRLHSRAALSGSGIPAHLLCCRKFWGCQGQIPQMGKHNVASLRGALQSTHRTRWNSGLCGQAGNLVAANEHWNLALDQCHQQNAWPILSVLCLLQFSELNTNLKVEFDN